MVGLLTLPDTGRHTTVRCVVSAERAVDEAPACCAQLVRNEQVVVDGAVAAESVCLCAVLPDCVVYTWTDPSSGVA